MKLIFPEVFLNEAEEKKDIRISKINQTINKYQEISVEMSEKIIDLITIFIFNTVLLPLLYLYLMLKGVRAIWISEIIEI